MIRHNLGYKLLALAITLVIWIYVNDFESTSESQGGRNSFVTATFTVPLKANRVESNLLVSSIPKEVSVVVEGHPDDIAAISAEQEEISAYVYLRGKPAGQHRIPVFVKLPEGFSGVHKRVLTGTVDVVLTQKQQRQMDIEPMFLGVVPETYRFSVPTISPANATVYGTTDAVNSVSRLVVQVNAEKLSDNSAEGSYPVLALDSSNQPIAGIEIEPQTASVAFGTISEVSKRAVFVSLNTVGQPAFPYRVAGIEINPQAVIVSGKPSDLSKVDMIPTELLQLSARKQTFTQRLKLVTPAGITLAGNDAVDVTVKITSSKPSDPSSGDSAD
ncbi:MAG TPA: CdaR family protein [Armatimonadota bacterium]|jgi:YbbR domain-containing protein